MMANREQAQFSFSHTVVAQGDGSFVIRPGKPVIGREKITVREAVRRYGTSKATIIRLYHTGFIEGERPTARKTLLFVDSIERHLKATQDPEFWDAKGGARRKRFLKYRDRKDPWTPEP